MQRAEILSKAHKVLKKHYKSVPPADRPLLEQMLFASCLENASYEKAETAFAALTEMFFDLNEVRVSSIAELSGIVRDLPDPREAALRLKKLLQGAFEATYSFDLEALKKQNIGAAVKKLQSFAELSPFVVAYATQVALGGHSIPLDDGAMRVLYIVGAADEDELPGYSVTGLERAIPKNKGIEFGSLLHQLGAELIARPQSPQVRSILVAINPEAKARLPKRRSAKSKSKKSASAAAASDQSAQSVRVQPKKKSAAKKKTADRRKAARAVADSTSRPKKKTSARKLAKKKPR